MTLEQELLQGAYNEVKIRRLLHDILPVLKFVHEHNILHRDIKPPNIIIRASDDKPVLIDFGVAKVLQSSSFIQQATALGTLHYAAPKQFRGSVFQNSDLYSLGITTYCFVNMYNGKATTQRCSTKISNSATKLHPDTSRTRIWAESDKYWRYLDIIALKLAQCSVTTI